MVEARKVCSPLQELLVVVPKAREIVFEDLRSGYEKDRGFS